MAEADERVRKTLVVRKPCFGLPTGCPQCLSSYIYLKLAQVTFDLDFNFNYPDSDQIPYYEEGDHVAYNNEKDGLIDCLKKYVDDIDSEISSLPDYIRTKVMLTTWVADALVYELWVGSDSSSAYNIYYSDLPWPIGKILFLKQAHLVKQKHEITKDNAVQKEEEIYARANSAYGALSTLLGEQNYLFEGRPSSLDAIFVAHALVVLQALPETSVLRIKLLEHSSLVRYVQKCKAELIDGTLPSSEPHFRPDASSSTSRSHSNWSSRPKSKPKREKTKEEKTFRRRAKYFVAAQLIAVVLFLTLMSGTGDNEVELDDDNQAYGYDD